MSKEEVILGIGISSVSGRTHQRALQEIDYENQVETVYKKEMKYTTTLVESVTELRKHLSSSLGGSATINNVAPEVNAAISASSDTSNHDLYYVIKINYVDHVDLLNGTMKSEEDANNLMNRDIQDFYRANGDSYVNSITYGKELLAVVQIKTDSKQSKVDADVDIKATNPLFTAKASTKAGIEKLAKYNIANISIFTKGTKASVSTVASNLKELKACISSFEKDSAEEKKVNSVENADNAENTPDNEAVPIEYTAHPYSRVFNENKNPSKLEDAIFNTKTILDKITRCFDRITVCLTKLKFEETNQLAIKFVDKYHEQAVKIKSDLQKMQDILQRKADQIQHKVFYTPDELDELMTELDTVVKVLSSHEKKIFSFAGRTLIATVESSKEPLPGHKHRSSKDFKLKDIPPGTKHLFFEVVPRDKNQNPNQKISFDVKRRRHVISNKTVYQNIETNTPKDMLKKTKGEKFYITKSKASGDYTVNIYAASALPPLYYTSSFSSFKPSSNLPSLHRTESQSGESDQQRLAALAEHDDLQTSYGLMGTRDRNENNRININDYDLYDVIEEEYDTEEAPASTRVERPKFTAEDEACYENQFDEPFELYEDSLAYDSQENMEDEEQENEEDISERNTAKLKLA